MSGKEKASAGAATPTEAMAAITGETEKTTRNHCNTSKSTVARLLKCGAENTTSTATLMKLLGTKDIRQFRGMVERERKDGIPILTRGGNGGGYFLPSGNAQSAIVELERFIHLQTARGIGTLQSMKPAKQLLKELKQQLSGQEEMDVWKNGKDSDI